MARTVLFGRTIRSEQKKFMDVTRVPGRQFQHMMKSDGPDEAPGLRQMVKQVRERSA